MIYMILKDDRPMHRKPELTTLTFAKSRRGTRASTMTRTSAGSAMSPRSSACPDMADCLARTLVPRGRDDWEPLN